jgi:Domain of unknown function (DUF4956)
MNWLGSPFVLQMGDALLAVLGAFVLVHFLAFSYVWSHRSMSYSTSFVRSMVLGSVATSVMMLAVGNNLAWGIGVMGALAMVRFRTSLRDPRDMMYMFAALITGICSGTHAYAIGLVGTLGFAAVALYLNHIPFGQTTQYDAMLRLTLAGANRDAGMHVHRYLERYCSRYVLSMLQPVSQGEAAEHVYQVRFRRVGGREELVRKLDSVEGLSGLSLMLEDARVDM